MSHVSFCLKKQDKQNFTVCVLETMSQLARITQTLDQLADEMQTTPDDVLRAANERGDAFERVVEGLDEHKRRAVADARECADIVAAAQRLKEAMDAHAAAFRESLVDVVEARYRVVEVEYDARIRAKSEEYDALIEPLVAELEKLRGRRRQRLGCCPARSARSWKSC